MMKFNRIGTQFSRLVLAATVFCFSALIVFSQDKTDGKVKDKVKNKDFCSNYNYSNGDKVQFKETRETTLAAGSLVNVDGKRNGGIRVKGENRSDVLVRACVQTVGATDEEAQAAAKGIRIETGSTIRAEGAGDESNSAVSYEILVPRTTNLKLVAHNGGISISGVEGNVEFETTNGGVNLSIPETYAARLETGTVNGGLKSDIAALNVERGERGRPLRINTDLNGGGAPIRVVTTNGGVRINSATNRNL